MSASRAAPDRSGNRVGVIRETMRPSLYARRLGPAFGELDEALRRGRSGGSGVRGHGVFRVERGGGLLGGAIGRLLRLPPAAERVAVELAMGVGVGVGVVLSGLRDLYAALELPGGGWPWARADLQVHRKI